MDYLINYFIVFYSLNVSQCFLKPTISSYNVLFCPELKIFSLQSVKGEQNRKIFTFKKLESNNFDLYFLKKMTRINKLSNQQPVNFETDI